MAKWFYYDNMGQKIETDSEGLKNLAENGIISSMTIIESQDGRQVTADKIKGLVISPPPISSTSNYDSSESFETMPVVTKHPEQSIAETTPPKEEKNEISDNRLLILCLASVFPGLGHFLLGCSIGKSIEVLAMAIFAQFFGMFAIAIPFLLLMAIIMNGTDATLENGGFQILVLLLTIIFLPFAIAFGFYSGYSLTLVNLHKEWNNAKTSKWID